MKVGKQIVPQWVRCNAVMSFLGLMMVWGGQFLIGFCLDDSILAVSFLLITWLRFGLKGLFLCD